MSAGSFDIARPALSTPYACQPRLPFGHHEFHAERISLASWRACVHPIRKASGPRLLSSIAAPRWVRVKNASFGAITAAVDVSLPLDRDRRPYARDCRA